MPALDGRGIKPSYRVTDNLNKGDNVAQKKKPELSEEAQAANAAGEALREKEKKARLKNAEKQKRFRESMKAGGHRRVTLWDLPGPGDRRMAAQGFRQVPAWELPQTSADRGRASKGRIAVQIRETSLHCGARQPEVQKALESATGEFLRGLGGTGGELGKENQALYSDFMELLRPMGNPREER